MKYAKEKKYAKALEVTSNLILGGESSLFYQATNWSNVYNFLKPSNDNSNLGRFLSKAQIRKSIHVGNTSFGDNEVYTHLENDMMVGRIISLKLYQIFSL